MELLVGRLTNLPAFLPFAWQRGINGIFMGAIPHSLENALGFLFDMADGGDYYARKRNKLFKARHPGENFMLSFSLLSLQQGGQILVIVVRTLW